ncbi:MAG: alpha-L-fucosidase [Spirochaetia bacterium]|jgi:alpha-L-fucosidase
MQTWESLGARTVPEWFDDAKLGVMVAWGPSSVPAWAPLSGDHARLVAESGWEYCLANDPRAEWYANSMRIPGSPTWQHHRAAWGRHTHYEAFGRLFRQGLKAWDPAPVSDAIVASGAKYLVAWAKHHDGFLLWPSRKRNPRLPEWYASPDVLEALAASARERGLRFGLYYSGGLDWTFGGLPIRSLGDLLEAVPSTRTYAAYVDAHMRELISRYQPSILWNDVCSPAQEDLLSLFSFYYDAVPDGLVNDRFGQFDPEEEAGLAQRLSEKIRRFLPGKEKAGSVHETAAPTPRHMDFRTVEEPGAAAEEERKWELVRAVGLSNACNSAESEESLLSVAALVRLLVDVVAHGGNLLLAVGPTAEGTVPEAVNLRLRGLGEWLKHNGEAIYCSRRWEVTEAVTDEGIEIRYTRKGMTVYAILMGTPAGRAFLLPSLRLLPYASLRILGTVSHASWFQEGRDVHVRLSEPLRESPAHVISITPAPRF